MSETKGPNKGLTRRGFLKTTGVVAGATAVGVGAAPSLQALAETSNEGSTVTEELVFNGICRGNCQSGCPVKIHTRGGKVVRVSPADCPDPIYNRICLKGITHPQRIYSPRRLMYPLKRTGERGSDNWERISWEEALDTICSTWKNLREEYGPGSIGCWSQSGSFGFLNGCNSSSAYNRLMNQMKAVSISGAIDMNYYMASAAMYGSGPSSSYNEITDLRHAKTLLVWGSNFTETQIQAWHFVADAIESGCKVVVIDPNFSTIAAKASRFVSVRAGTDAVLAFGMANILIEDGLTDVPFLKKSTVAPFLVKEIDGKYLRKSDLGQADPGTKEDEILVWDTGHNTAVAASEAQDPVLEGSFTVEGVRVRTAYDLLLDRLKEYPPEKASGICEVPLDVMKEVAHLYASNKPSSIWQGFGYDRYYNGHSTFTAIGAFAMLSGNIGKKGSSAGICQPNSLAFDVKKCTMPIRASGEVDAGAQSGFGSYTAGVLALKLTEAVESGVYNNQPFNLKSIYINNCNPLNYVADRQALLKVFDQMEMIVSCEIHMTDTARYADIVLPVAHWFEVEDVTNGSAFLQPYLVLQEKAVDSPGECKSDYEILNLLAEGMGWPGVYDGKSPEEALRYILDNDAAKKLGITYDRLKKEKIIRTFPDEEYIYAKDGVFNTATKRAQFYFEKLTPSMNWGQEIDADLERLPFFTPPQEAWAESELFTRYPLICFQEHTRWRTHSVFSHVPWLKELDPEPVVKISRKDAEARGICSGELVKVFNDRGHVVLKAIVSDGLRPGMCNIPKGWQEDQFIEGHYQDLSSRETNPYVANSQFSDLLVEIEKR